MQYRGTAIQIYDMPMSASASASDLRWERRLAMLVSALVVLAIVGLVGFVGFGIISQRF